jgi:phosphohistidine swiveling domain-containing protein
MSAPICWLQDVPADQVALVGGKAANLARMMRLGLPVPAGFVVTTEAYRAVLSASGLEPDADPDTLHRSLLNASMPAAIENAFRSAYEALGTPLIAVRSSGTAEDLVAASFAGQHDTFLNVSGIKAVLTAVRGCWASLWSPRAVDYRRQRGWDDADLAIAVVIQVMVPAQRAGVLFTADPVSGQRDHIVIEAVAGLGEGLVSGEQSGEHLVLDKATGRLLTGVSPLTEQALADLVQLGRQVEAAFGSPQDIEWAYADEKVLLLQARPMTALPDEHPPQTPPRRYSRLQRAGVPNAIEHMPIAPYPFDYSLFFRPALERGLQALHALGFVTSAIDDVYVPIADGVVQMVPPAIRPTLRALTLPGRLIRSLRARPEDWLAACRCTLVATAEQIDEEDLSGLSEQELLERITRLRELQIDLLIRRFAYFPQGVLASQGLAVLLRRLYGTKAQRIEADLLAAIPSVTTEGNQALVDMAREIRANPMLRQVFANEPAEQMATRLPRSAPGRELLAAIDAFLKRYGSREITMPSAALPSWRDQPSVVYGLLKALVAGEPSTDTPEADGTQRTEQARRAVEATLSRGWLGLNRRVILPGFHRLLAATRAFVAFREDSHFSLMQPFTVVRRLALELGARLVKRGVLEKPDDVFYLEIEELERLGPAEAVRETVRRRQDTRRSVEGRYTSVPSDLLEQPNHRGEIRGVAASPGQVSGRVRIIRSEHDFGTLEKGEILVARYTNPTWTPLFRLASAVVVDAGGTASHAAIVAREYGIPAVMGTGSATSQLHTGQRVLVDGTVGRVMPLSEGGDV